MRIFFKLLLPLSLAMVFFIAALYASTDEAQGVIIVVNSNDPSSRKIGQYYAEQRGIPKENIIELKTSTEETITPKEYVDTIYNPLLTKLIDLGRVEGVRSKAGDRFGRRSMSVAVNSVSYLVTIRGIPLRISNDSTLLELNASELPKQFQVNRAALDNELALLIAPNSVSMTALIRNPFFDRRNPTSSDRSRILRVSRLDGPDAASVMRLIDRTLEGEQNGLMGRAYIDVGGPFPKGDTWFNTAADFAEAAYFDTDIEVTKKEVGIQSRFDAPAIYMGWYQQNATELWRRPRWSVPPGAIAYHLHSFSATTLRDIRKGWVAAFVNQGYSTALGTVYEPYLEQTHRPDLFLGYLLEGKTFGEAVLYSTPVLSWMNVAIGDPLYRPFKVDLREQLTRNPMGPFASFVHLREINRLKSEVSDEAALQYARSQYVEQPSLALAYKLSNLYSDLGQAREGAEALKIIRYITEFSDDEKILAKLIADQLHIFGESQFALEIYESLIAQRNLPKEMRIAILRGGAKVSASLGSSVQSSRWNIEAQQLETPPAAKK